MFVLYFCSITKLASYNILRSVTSLPGKIDYLVHVVQAEKLELTDHTTDATPKLKPLCSSYAGGTIRNCESTGKAGFGNSTFLTKK